MSSMKASWQRRCGLSQLWGRPPTGTLVLLRSRSLYLIYSHTSLLPLTYFRFYFPVDHTPQEVHMNFGVRYSEWRLRKISATKSTWHRIARMANPWSQFFFTLGMVVVVCSCAPDYWYSWPTAAAAAGAHLHHAAVFMIAYNFYGFRNE